MSPEPSGRPISRRNALQRGVMVGGALLWAAPTVQVFSASANAADVASQPPPPPSTNPPTTPPPGGTGVEGTNTGSPPSGGTEVEGTKTSAGSLPRTGVAFPPIITAVVGTGLLAGGAAMRRWAREGDDETAADTTRDPIPDPSG